MFPPSPSKTTPFPFLTRPGSAILLAIPFILCSNLLAYVFFGELDNPQVHGVPDSRFARVPLYRSKLTGPLFVPPSLEQSRHRAYMSIFPNFASDGMGNGFTSVNYDFLFAQFLNVTYIHRDARYGSLSPDEDPTAVERLFGWDNYPYIRSKMISDICEKVELRKAPRCGQHSDETRVKDKLNETGDLPVCVKLRKGSPFKRIVNIPHELSDCLLGGISSECRSAIAEFSARHSEDGILFQMAPHNCGNIYRNPDFRRSGAWFRHMYWTKHKNSTSTFGGEDMTRVLSGFRSQQIQFAVHIRRGDFFMANNRVLLADREYADIIATVGKITRRLFGESFSVRAVIYSEGVPKEGEKLRHTHDVSKTDRIYVDENQTRHDDGQMHWEGLLRERGFHDVQVTMRVGTDTIDAIHGMACADVFIGSMSSLSRTVISALARGVVLIPSTREQFNDLTNKGQWRLNFVYDDDAVPVADEGDIEDRLVQVLQVMMV